MLNTKQGTGAGCISSRDLHTAGNHKKLNQKVFQLFFKELDINNFPTAVKLRLEKELYVIGRTKQKNQQKTKKKSPKKAKKKKN